MYKKCLSLIWVLFLCGIVIVQMLKHIEYIDMTEKLAEFRAMKLEEEFCEQLDGNSKVGELVAKHMFPSEERLYISEFKIVWNDVKYFPIPEIINRSDLSVHYSDTWMSERTYGGNRHHEGTDIMANKNQRGLYPIVSMTDGTVTNKGWLEKGGYRIGITAPSGAYFYYAHLESYSHIEVGDKIKAGDLLGFMGDSGYGKEGTVGQFAVHLHLGIYVYLDGKEVSVNPYWVLRYIEKQRVKCYTKE